MASVGTLVAAALETAGYRAQQNVLVDLAPLVDGLAMFLFTASAIMGILAVVYGGSYRMALYMFVGPALFYFFTKNTVTARASDFQFGAFQAPATQVEDVICGEDARGETRICDEDTSKVSWVFDSYNQLVSSIVQNSVRVLTNNSLKNQLLFMTRQRIMARMFDFSIEDPGLKQLIHTGLKEKCRDLMESSRIMALGNRDENYKTSTEYLTAVKRYADVSRSAEVKFESGTAARQTLADLLTVLRTHEDVRESAKLYCPTGNLDAMISSTVEPTELLDNPMTCEQLWCFTGIAVVQRAKSYKEQAEKQFVPEYARSPGTYSSNPTDGTLDLVRMIEEELTVKMTPPDRENLDHLGPPRVTPDVSMIPVIIGGMLLRKSMAQDPRSEMYSELADHVGYKTHPYTFSTKNSREDTINTTVKLNNHTMAEALRHETYTWAMAMAIPYLQGLLLYALSVLFPFFCVTLVIPGKAHTIVSWMALWAWVKSWDIGWAIVMIADDTIWNLMPHSSVMKLLDDPTHGPITVMESAFGGDPTYNLTNYYLLLSMMLYAVPVITAQVVLGAKAAMGGMMLTSIRSYGEKVGGSVGDFTSIEQQQDTHHLQEETRRSMVESSNQRLLSNLDGGKGGGSGGGSGNSDLSRYRANPQAAQRNISALNDAISNGGSFYYPSNSGGNSSGGGSLPRDLASPGSSARRANQ